MEFITLKRSHSELDLLVYKSRLEAEGIPCFLKNQYTTQIMSHMPTFMVELQVNSTDAEKAIEILQQFEKK